MHATKTELPVLFSPPQGTIRTIEWGGMMVDVGSFQQEGDPASLGIFNGLPEDRCPVPHWGYVIEGQVHFRFADHEEVYHAGEVFYAPPSHTPVISANTEWVEFSPADLYEQTREVMARNVAALQPPS